MEAKKTREETSSWSIVGTMTRKNEGKILGYILCNQVTDSGNDREGSGFREPFKLQPTQEQKPVKVGCIKSLFCFIIGGELISFKEPIT